ncbi:sulfur carrier protein ThiS [Vibrio ostreicida]|uniref:Sulfur carrier protein ThiS n=1 Tax=Vibrio ostreicida TaxID=526588 RepID=A0ABT8BPU6_9VIBR|nr:sulfur carrier protein ThiS [Vibrio ostreicida]MDN3608664.1 sulfur carrier protein ThiS [Vibrio ostreicida]NPD10652.1 sulfur carrier protein ThiS [Vibrio ostreicida]
MRNIQVEINGQKAFFEHARTLADIMASLGMPLLGCAIAVNGVVVPRVVWTETNVTDGDSISIFKAIAGG